MYVPSDGPADRFVPAPGGLHRLHLVEYVGGLRLCQDETGLLVGPTDRRLQRAGLYVTNVRGVSEAARRADLGAGRPLRLVREPDNPHDPFAVAVHPNYGKEPIGYVNRQKARHWSKLIAEGARLTAVSLRGTGPRDRTGSRLRRGRRFGGGTITRWAIAREKPPTSQIEATHGLAGLSSPLR